MNKAFDFILFFSSSMRLKEYEDDWLSQAQNVLFGLSQTIFIHTNKFKVNKSYGKENIR